MPGSPAPEEAREELKVPDLMGVSYGFGLSGGGLT
jgi:hypothetical protein